MIRIYRNSFLYIIAFLIFIPNTIIRAETPKVHFKTGIIEFKTKDTTATSAVTWSTEGFIITRKKCLSGPQANGGYPLKIENGKFLLKPEWKNEEKKPGGITEVTFTIPEEVVNKALLDAGLDEIKGNDIIYLHAVHQVRHQGKPYGSLKYDYPSIRNAEAWANPNDFNDRFDIPVYYEASGPQPIKITYLTGEGKAISSKELPKKKWVNLGEMAEVTLDKTVSFAGKTLYLAKSYQCYLAGGKRIAGTTNSVTGVNAKDYEKQLPSVRIRKKKQVPGGLEFVAVMREKKTIHETGSPDLIEEKLATPAPYGIIGADERYKEAFDVLEGIPVTEHLYANVITSNYLMGYRWKRISGEKQYHITVKKTYRLSWKEETEDENGKKTEIEKSEEHPVSKSYLVKRPYSYWIIGNLDFYGISKAVIHNAALPGGVVTVKPREYEIPKLSFTHLSTAGDHIREPAAPKVIDLGSESIEGREAPSEDFGEKAQAAVRKIRVRNDKVTFNGTEVMNGSWQEENGNKPSYMPDYGEDIGENVIYRSGMKIKKDIANGRCPSDGTVSYERIQSLNPEYGAALSYKVEGLNPVIIHTPVVCDASISDDTAFNQMLAPDPAAAGLILDRSFTVCIPTEGGHRYIKGYGYRDYKRYAAKRQVRFPFDVYCEEKYYRANTWITISKDYTSFYLPIWVDEGHYTVTCRIQAVNALANEKEDETEPLANLNLNHYTAEDTVPVEVSGRVYGFSLYDISDYPLWREVFRLPNSLKISGFTYKVGTKDQNGSSSGQKKQFTLPLIQGCHPSSREAGYMKGGYTTRFYLTTIGNMYRGNDTVRIRPRFYYISPDGKQRMEVDVYYSESVGGNFERLIKAGGRKDRENIKICRTGDPWMGIPYGELQKKAVLEGKSVKDVEQERAELFSFTNISIPGSLRFYSGEGCVPGGKTPGNVDKNKVMKSKQKWYGEYYLPSQMYLTKKGFDVDGYSKEHRLTLHEAFWLQEGYLAVNFDIETIQDGKRHLSYLNLDNTLKGYCNMWETEGFSLQKIDGSGKKFFFEYGDYTIYKLGESASVDYKNGGTH